MWSLNKSEARCSKLKYIEENEDAYSQKLKTDLKRNTRIFKFLSDIFFKIVFEGIKIVTTLECVRSFVLKGWTSVRQRRKRLHSDN